MRPQHTSRHLVGQERGIALIAALMIMLLMSALMIGFTTVVMSDQRYRGIDKDRTRAYYGAQSGLEKLSTDLGNLFLTNVAPTSTQVAALGNTPPAIPGVAFTAPAGVTAYGIAPTKIPCPQTLMDTCSAAIATGPYQGLIALKKLYTLDAVACTSSDSAHCASSGGEAHLTRKVESVAIPVFQFGMFSDVDLSFFAGNTFDFGGRIHTNGNLYLTAQNTYTTILRDKVTAVGDIIRARLQNGLALSTAGFNGTLSMATGTNTFRNLKIDEGSVTDGFGSSVNTNWPTVSIGTYHSYIRNGGCPSGPTSCTVPPRGTGAKRLDLAMVNPVIGGQNTDLTRRPLPNEDSSNPVLFGERMFAKKEGMSLRILLSDKKEDITGLPTVTSSDPVRLGDEGGPGVNLTNDWATAGSQPAGVSVAGTALPNNGAMTPIARSPGLQTISLQANAAVCTTALPTGCTLGLPTAGIVLAAGSPYNSPNTLTFDLLDNMGNAVSGGTVLLCQAVTSTQVQSCTRQGGSGPSVPAVSANYLIRAKDGSSNGKSMIVTASQTSGSPKTYTVSAASSAAVVANTFWMQDSGDQTWDLVTCTGIGNATATSGGVVNQFKNCTPVPAANKTNAITTGALVGQYVGTIGGWLKIEIQKSDGSGWQDVTKEILNWGFGDTNQDGAICDDPTPNAIIRLQRLKDNGGTCHYSRVSSPANNVAVSTKSYDYWPQTIFDPREGLFRNTRPANKDVPLGGVMHYVALDVKNLSKWFKCQAPYNAAGCSGTQVLTNNGYSVYFSDRRNNRADGTNGTTLNAETGEYGFEDVVNPLDAAGTPNNALDGGEDVNGNGKLDVYGQYPTFLGKIANVLADLPPGAVGPTFNDPTKIRPGTMLGRSAAVTSRAYLFRRALKLVNGDWGNIVTPGLTVVAENPVYIQGDWNWDAAHETSLNDPHAETSVIADSVTLLSSQWTDSNAFVNPYDAKSRNRDKNYYRLAIIAGKGMAFPWPSAGTPDNTFGTDGGAHNFLRFLETNPSTDSTRATWYRGAIATFYYSRQAVGTFKFSTDTNNAIVYTAPTRQFAFDTDFLDPAKLPPLTPVFRDINALGFAQEIRPGK